jgi:hypothetical protein
MALAQTKTYTNDNNSAWTNTTTASLMFASMLLAIQQALCNTILTTSMPAGATWTVDSSCDGTTAGTSADGVNRWTDSTKVIRSSGAVAHSWMVLKHATLGYWLLIDYSGSADYNVKLWLGKAAFTGGTTTAAPTSTASAQTGTTAFWTSSDVVAAAGKISKCVDATGRFTLLWGKTGAGKAISAMGLTQCVGGYSGDTTPDVLWLDAGTTTNPPCHANQNSWRTTTTQAMVSRNWNNTAAVICSPLAYCGNNASGTDFIAGTMNGPDAQDGKYIDYPIRVGVFTASNIADKGVLQDWSWAPYGSSSSTLAQNTMAENSGGTPTHILIGSCWIPWNTQPTW